jgi:outer membrane immunogenic protein
MKKIILAIVLAGIGSASALAADMGARTPYAKAPAMMATVTNWSGFYLGGNVGYGWGHNNTDFSFLPSAATFGASNDSLAAHSKGVIGGAQFGYNWQFGSTVLGFETDIQGSGISGSATKRAISVPPATLDPASSLFTDSKLSWFGTARVRLGFEIAPALLLYGTGGLAYGQPKATANSVFPGAPLSLPVAVSATKVGWTAGVGTEWMFARNWSAKAEYLYVDLGNTSAVVLSTPAGPFGAGYTWKNQDHIVRAGVNYHF